MVSGAKTEITIGRQFKKDRIDIQQLKSRLRQQSSPGARIPPRFGTGPSGARLDPVQRLATQGDTMIGPIAFIPVSTIVSAGVIDIGIQTSEYSSRIIVLGAGGVADDLDTILNARFAGQFLALQAVATTPITLKHLTGNIRIPSGIDYVVKGLETVILMFDATTNEWVLVTGDSGLTNPMTQDFDMAGFNILNLDIINWEDGDVEESVALGIKWTMALNHSIEIQNSSLVRQVFIDTQAPSFDLSVLLRMVGSVEQTLISQLDGVDAAFQIETSGPQWLFKIDGTNVFQVVEEVPTTEYAFNPLVTGDGGFKYFFESGTYFTGSAASGRINVYNDGVNRYFFTNNEFAIFDENLLLTGSTFGGYMQVLERAADPGGLADNFRLYGKDDAGVTKAFVQWSDGTVKELGGGGEFFGPWTADHDAGGKSLLNLGDNTAVQDDAITITKDEPGVAGTRDSNRVLLEGTAFDGVGHTAQWRYFIDVTGNSGVSIFVLQNRIDAASFATKFQISDSGLVTLSGDLNANNNDFVSVRDIQLQAGFQISKLFFDGGGDTYFTGSGTSGRINIVNDNAQNYSFLTTEFAIFGGRNILMSGATTGGFIEMLERIQPAGFTNSTRLYSKDVAGLTELFYVNSAGTERDLSAVSGEVNTGQNVGAGTGLIFRDKTGVFINLRSLIGGTNVTVTNNADDITISSISAGANTQLSNLTSPTSINQDLRPDASNRDVGIASDRWKEMNCEDMDTDSTFKHAKGETAGNQIAFFGKVLQTHRTVTRVVIGEALSLTQAKIQSLQDALNDYNLVST